MKNYFRIQLLKFVGWFAKNVLNYLGNPLTHHYITSKDYRSLKEVFMPGTVLLTRTKAEVTNLVIPGFFKHAAIVVNENEVTEAAGNGVVRTDLIDFLMAKDYVIALKPKFATKAQMKKAAEIATQQEGKPYDFDIIMSDIEKFYCFELVYFSYAEAVENMPFVPREIMGRDTIISSDFINASDKWEVFWASKSVLGKEIY